MVQTSVTYTGVYKGNSTITFETDNRKGVSVTIDTPHLRMKSVQSDPLHDAHYSALFGDKNVMAKYATGQTKTPAEMHERVANWAKRWREGDPYSAFAVFKKDTDEFVGHAILGHGDRPGESEMAGLAHEHAWNKKYGHEAAAALVNEYAPVLIREGFHVEGKPLKNIVATARTDNPATIKILEKLGMTRAKTEEKFGAERHHYVLDLTANPRICPKRTYFSIFRSTSSSFSTESTDCIGRICTFIRNWMSCCFGLKLNWY